MGQILDEYGEAIIGVIAALLIVGTAYFLFQQGGIIDIFLAEAAGNAI